MGIMANIMQNARFIGGDNLELAAAGSDQATAVLAGGAVNVVTDAIEGTALLLPSDRALSDLLIIINSAGAALSVFPPEGGTIGAAAENAATSLADGKTAIFVSLGSGNWAALLSA